MKDKGLRDFMRSRYNFPCRIVYYIGKFEGKYKIVTKEHKDRKKKIGNIKFEELQAIIFGGVITPIDVADVDDVDQLIEQIKGHSDTWIGKNDEESEDEKKDQEEIPIF